MHAILGTAGCSLIGLAAESPTCGLAIVSARSTGSTANARSCGTRSKRGRIIGAARGAEPGAQERLAFWTPESPLNRRTLPVSAHNSVVGADQGFRAPSGDQESVHDAVHEDSASARIATGQRPRPSFRHPQDLRIRSRSATSHLPDQPQTMSPCWSNTSSSSPLIDSS